jgi:hypothetical protein
MLAAERLATSTSREHTMAGISGARARAVAAARASGDDWDFDSEWDDEVGPAWIKDYTGGVKHRGYAGSAQPLASNGSTVTPS